MLHALLALLVQALPNAHLVRADIVFDAKATVADFQGIARAAAGELIGAERLEDVKGWVEVRWRDIDTRNGTRNRHMLETVRESRYPVIRFDVMGAVPESASGGEGGDSAAVLLKGLLTLHGQTREVEWPTRARLHADSVIVAADFPVDMRDYGIKPPTRFIIARMGAVVRVHVRLTFRSEAGSEAR